MRNHPIEPEEDLDAGLNLAIALDDEHEQRYRHHHDTERTMPDLDDELERRRAGQPPRVTRTEQEPNANGRPEGFVILMTNREKAGAPIVAYPRLGIKRPAKHLHDAQIYERREDAEAACEWMRKSDRFAKYVLTVLPIWPHEWAEIEAKRAEREEAARKAAQA